MEGRALKESKETLEKLNLFELGEIIECISTAKGAAINTVEIEGKQVAEKYCDKYMAMLIETVEMFNKGEDRLAFILSLLGVGPIVAKVQNLELTDTGFVTVMKQMLDISTTMKNDQNPDKA
jgi:predicted ThiF/HesA family dinucleotide-utilizing enzyme